MTSVEQHAILQFHEYLSGLTPPVRAAGLFETVAVMPPQHVAAALAAWVDAQRQANPGTSTSDYLFHALRRLYLLGESGIVDADRVDTLLERLLPLSVNLAPAEERARLRGRLVTMTQRISVVPTFAGNVAIPVTETPVVVTPIEEPDAAGPSSAEFDLIVERVGRERAAGRTYDPDEALGIVARLVTLAAIGSKTRDDLREMFRRIPPLVDPSQLGNVFQLLGGTIPPWEVALPSEERAAFTPEAIRGMRRMIDLSADDLERAKRMRELIMAAVRQFNAGSLFAASAMLDLARSVQNEVGISPTAIGRVAAEASGIIDANQLRTYIGDRSRHALVREILGFFPSHTPEALLAELRGEPRAERRRALLALLEAWGPAARDAALKRLTEELEDGPGGDTWFLRNAIFLLHRIPRESDDSIDEELEILRKASTKDHVIYVIKEAITAAGTLRGTGAARLLIERLSELENSLVRADQSRGPATERIKAIDRALASLTKVGTPEALRRIVSHGLKVEPALGNTRGRLAVLSAIDLSSSTDAVEALLSAIRAELPSTLGRVIGKQANPAPLIHALASTDTPAVRTLLDEISSRYQKVELGSVAENVRTQLGTAAARIENTSKSAQGVREGGELRPFGLPALVLSFAEQNATGELAIADPEKRGRGRLIFVQGRLTDAEGTKLRGEDAFFDLVERPHEGWFTFTPQETAGESIRGEAAALVLEALRRYDELTRARILVPDRSSYRHVGSKKPTPHPGERDAAAMKEIWRRTSAGSQLQLWESDIPADRFRVRRLVAHWLMEGSIAVV